MPNRTQSVFEDAPREKIECAIAGIAHVAPTVGVGDFWKILAYLGKHGLIHPALYEVAPQYAKDAVK